VSRIFVSLVVKNIVLCAHATSTVYVRDPLTRHNYSYVWGNQDLYDLRV